MLLQKDNFIIRNATVDDAKLLAAWWNDGRIMAHAGFPNGTGETAAQISEKIRKDTDENRRLIIELDNIPIGEMSYRSKGDRTVEIGIKICDFSRQDKGYGKVLLSMLISSLFADLGYERVVLDTNFNNKRARYVYEKLGFKMVQIRENAWRDQLGVWQTAVDYELLREDFVNFAE